jgi:hypothetical protein
MKSDRASLFLKMLELMMRTIRGGSGGLRQRHDAAAQAQQ